MVIPTRWRSLLRRPAVRVALIVVALGATYGVPRMIALQGISHSSNLQFGDMFFHLYRMDIAHKRATLPASLISDPFLKEAPALITQKKVMRWPKGLYRVASPFNRIFGPMSLWTTLLTNLLFTVIMVLGVIALGSAMGSVRAGIWGAALSLLCPGLVAHSWYFSMDYALIGMVLVGLYFLWRTRGFREWRWCLAVAGWSVLGLHIKITYLLYLAVPGAAALVVGLRKPGGRPRVLIHTLAVVVVTLLASLWLNDWNLKEIWTEFTHHAATAGKDSGFPYPLLEPWTLRWALSMPLFAISNFPWPLLLLAAPGLLLIHLRRAPAARWLLLSFFWSTLIALTLISNKMERYLQPIYPVLCLLVAWSVVSRIPRRWRTAALIWATIAFGSILYLTQIRGTPWFVDRRAEIEERYMHELAMPDQITRDNLRRYTYHQFCDIRPLLREIEALSKKRASRPIGIEVLKAKVNLLPHISKLVLSLTHRNRDQLWLYNQPGNKDPNNNPFHRVPTLIAVHSPEIRLADRLPALKVLARRDLQITCEGLTTRLQVTMAEPR